MKSDLCFAQFLSILEREGFSLITSSTVDLGIPGRHWHANRFKGGMTRRGQLRYLRQERSREFKRLGRMLARKGAAA